MNSDVEQRIKNNMADAFSNEIAMLLSDQDQPVHRRYKQIMQLVQQGLSIIEGFNDMVAKEDAQPDATIAKMMDELEELLKSGDLFGDEKPPIQ